MCFRNEPGLGGGWLLLGIAEPDHEHDNFWVNGVHDIDNLLGALQNNCRNQFEHPVRIECKSAKIDGKSVIGVFVHELEPRAKPCRFIGKPDKHNKRKTGVWRRGANGDYECTEEELEPILMAKAGLSYEQVILPDVSLDDLEFAETKGTGFQIMHRLLHESGLTKPILVSNRPSRTFKISLLLHQLMSEEHLTWLQQWRHLNLSDDEAKTLIFILEMGAVDNAVNGGTKPRIYGAGLN